MAACVPTGGQGSPAGPAGPACRPDSGSDPGGLAFPRSDYRGRAKLDALFERDQRALLDREITAAALRAARAAKDLDVDDDSDVLHRRRASRNPDSEGSDSDLD